MSELEISLRSRVDEIQEMMRKLPQVTLATQHYLCEGMYVRQAFIPKGTAFVGRVHKSFHIFILARGSAAVTTDDGLVSLQAGMVLLSKPGTKRCGVTSEDCVFITVHRTTATDLKDIEAELTEFDPTSRYGVGNEILNDLLEHL